MQLLLALGVVLGAAGGCAIDRSGLSPHGMGIDAGDMCGCDDGIGCTVDRCLAGACTNRPDDSLCTVGPGGRCVIGSGGCEYESCSPASCMPRSACEAARCEGMSCVRTSTCTTNEMCCGGACVADGCDDGNPCTADSCSPDGCAHEQVAGGACDDGVFCNGADSCGGGECSEHAGNPCSGAASTCSPTLDTCVGCVGRGDCPPNVDDPWGACGGFGDVCQEVGTQTRMRRRFTCTAAGACEQTVTPQSRGCTRAPTDGISCGGSTTGPWGVCGGFADDCAQTGTQSRTTTERRCLDGACTDQSTDESRSCSRMTAGNSCGPVTTGPWTTCGGFIDPCDQDGTRTRAVTTPLCAGGTCADVMSTEAGACSRITDGDGCDDGNVCSDPDVCSGGACLGVACVGTPCSPATCTGSGCMRSIVTCSPSDCRGCGATCASVERGGVCVCACP